jgi:D-beta-D-heptose 7-phosphate kinase/D-beta-D-heptose 1-phosphate adenosyltransferase
MISGLKKHWIPGQARNDEQGYGASVNLHHFVPGMSDLFGEFIFMNQSAKIITRNALETELMQVRASGKKIILHLGHVRYLTAAKSHGDVLVVGLNSDRSVQLIKGDDRPIIEQRQRAEVLAALRVVDYVTPFNETDPLKLIECLRPDVLVKGDDWALDNIIGADVVQEKGGRVVRIPVVADISTSIVIDRIRERF